MDSTLGAAGVGALATLAAAYISGLVLESYRRFHDGSAIAAGLAGEMASHGEAMVLVRQMFADFTVAVANGKRETILLRPIDRPRDNFYDAIVGKVGLLPADVVEDVVFVYAMIGAFRVAFAILARDYSTMSDYELSIRLEQVVAVIDKATSRGLPMLAVLRQRARASFLPMWKLTGS